MTLLPTRLPLEVLLDHARTAARGDEWRHASTNTGTTSSQSNEKTLRGWGSAALLDLEWSSHWVYGKEERTAYRAAYAVEYLQRRSARQ